MSNIPIRSIRTTTRSNILQVFHIHLKRYKMKKHTTFEKKTIDNFHLLERFTARGGDTRCSVCQEGAALVEVMRKDEEPLNKIKEAMTNFCHRIGIYDPEICQARIDDLVPEIIKLLSRGLTPLQICKQIKSCVSTMSLSINP